MDPAKAISPSFVVGIGASAGGLEAIERLFDRMPVDTGMAFVIVQHLSPDFKSLMHEVLARWTPMPIQHVEDGVQVEPNSIYLIPPKKEMVIADGRLLLTDRDMTQVLSRPIDHFLRSLAQDCGRKSIAIILSGTGSDGSRGVVDIHEAGGLVISQVESTAKFDGMPRAAHESGVADLVLSPEEIPESLVDYALGSQAATVSDPLGTEAGEETGLRHVFALLRDSCGLDFSHYKLNTVVRRTERRLMLTKKQHIDDYIEQLKRDPEELGQLYKDLLIGVTRFFRDAEAFERLGAGAIAEMVERLPDGAEIRAWVAGCATGEEAYTLAILLHEAVNNSGKQLHIKVFATDVHQESIDTAGHGIYPESSLAEAPAEYVARYFRPVAGGYQVVPSLRQKIVFAPHNLVKDAPFTKIDLISCRNLLIYLQPHAQRKILSLFHFGLKTGGVLMLGPSESPGEVVDEFESVDSHWKIYRKLRDTRLPADMRLQLTPGPRGGPASGLPPTPPVAVGETLAMSMYDALLERALPPSLLVSESGELLHTFGDAGAFLRAERGRHTADIRERLVDELRVPISTAIGKALKDDKAVSYSGVPVVDGEGVTRLHEISAEPFRDTRKLSRSILVCIEVAEAPAAEWHGSEAVAPEEFSTEQIGALETELRYTKENLQATIEELETSNEELQATNEELVASNEELQSTNEELHSVNEELYTVNAEHQNKIVELSELTRDMDKLLESTEVDTVFFDSDLRIRKFTPRVARWFNFLSQDVGRRIDSFTHSIECEGVAEKIEAVVRTGRPHEEEVRDGDGAWFLMRILPYRTASDHSSEQEPDGALLTLFDITRLKDASDALVESLGQRDRFLAMLSHELRNPVATILNASRMLSTGADANRGDEPEAVIGRQSRHIATLLDDLLDVTRVSQGKIQLHRRPFELLPVVDQAIESVEMMTRAREQTIVADLAEEPIWVFGSEPRILQVVTNLLANASKYSGVGDRIDLAVSADAEMARIQVSDQGVGISPEQIEKIFDLFVQADRTLDRADSGLGVGLTLVKSLVKLHGGEVSAHSDGEGKGSEFCVQLPTCQRPAPDQSLQEPPATSGNGASSGSARKLVLIEDNLDASKMLTFLLEEAGHQVAVAYDGKRGLELVRSNRPEVAIIDVGLPGMNGYEVARTLREDPRFDRTYLIALTGYGQEQDRTDALKAGFDKHFVKPVDPETLDRILRDLPPRERAERSLRVDPGGETHGAHSPLADRSARAERADCRAEGQDSDG